MTTTPSEARAQIVNMVRDFVRREVEPVAAEHDREDTVPHDLIDRMKELGLFGITVPEEYGGMGLDYTTFASIFEELSKGFMTLSGAIGTHHILTYVLTHYGPEEQKQRFLPDLASGRKRGGLALTEPSGGTDMANLQTTATKNGEEYTINGTKMFITNGRPHRPGHGTQAQRDQLFRSGEGRSRFHRRQGFGQVGLPGIGHLRVGFR